MFYAGGLAMGNFVGILIDEKLSIWTVGVRIINRREAQDLIYTLKKANYRVIAVDTKWSRGKWR